jgi:hypothetical protein
MAATAVAFLICSRMASVSNGDVTASYTYNASLSAHPRPQASRRTTKPDIWRKQGQVFTSRSAVNPIPRRFARGGFMSSRIAANIAAMALS